MIRLLVIVIILLFIDLFIGACIAFFLHHSESDEPFKVNKEVFMFMLTGWWMYLWRLIVK